MTFWTQRAAVAAIAMVAGLGLLAAAPGGGGAVPADMQAVLDKPLYAHSAWGLRVLDGDKVLVDYQPERKFFIGSVRKVFSVGQLMDAVGPQHTYDTPVYRTGDVARGVLHGNLIVVASGDLTMGGRTNPDGSIAVSDWDHNEADSLGSAILTKPNPLAGYERLARAVRAAGITRVAGDVAIDDRLWVPWHFRDQFDVRPIFVNDDCVDVSIVPSGAPGSLARVAHRPASAALALVNQLRVGPPKTAETLKIEPELPACIGTVGCTAAVTGSIPSDFKPPLTNELPLVQVVRIVQPSNFARTVFIEALRKAGVAVDAPSVASNPVALLPTARSYASASRVALLRGLPYAEDAKLVLKISYNIGADTSLVLFGLTHHVDSMPAALAVERKNLLARYGIAPSSYHFVDGSGGGDTTATSEAVTTMLQAIAKSRVAEPFVQALPVLGVDGSLGSVKGYESDATLAGATGAVRAKTGTYVGAAPDNKMELKGQALGGYVTTKSGRHLTFQMVVNNVPIGGIPDVLEVFQDQGRLAAMLWRDY